MWSAVSTLPFMYACIVHGCDEERLERSAFCATHKAKHKPGKLGTYR